MISFEKVAIVGSGNVAFAYAKMLKDNGCGVYRMLVRDNGRIREVKEELNVEATLDYGEIHDCDMIIIAVNDDAIGDVACNIGATDALVLHTSGMKPSAILNKFSHYGVMYPLQTLTKGFDVDFKKLPFLVNASSSFDLERLVGFVSQISDYVKVCSDECRSHIHMCAVYVSNFVNVMLQIGNELLGKIGYEISFMEPLVRETVNKSFALGPDKALTGPARRGDAKTINDHKLMLNNNLKEKEIYELLTDYITNKYSEK